MEEYYCPECLNKLERLSGCGAVGYMCNTCKHLVSRKKMLSQQEIEERKHQDPVAVSAEKTVCSPK